MNLLSLTQRLAQECGVSGTITTTAGVVGEQLRLVTWALQAFTEIQTRHDDWEWMRSSNALGQGASFATVAGQAAYPLGTGAGTIGIAASDFGKWDRETFRNYTTLAGTSDEIYLDDIPYDAWRDVYFLGANRTVQTRPIAIAVGPNNSLCCGPPSNGLYTITADYFIAPTTMASDTATPTGLPNQFHMAIVYLAMTYYAGYEAAPEVMQRGQFGYDKLMAQLEALRLPIIGFAGALC